MISVLNAALFAIPHLAVGTDFFVGGVHHYPWGYYARYGPRSVPFLVFFFGLMLFNLRLYWLPELDNRQNLQTQGSHRPCWPRKALPLGA